MANYYLDQNGLSRVWDRIKQYISAKYVDREEFEEHKTAIPVWEKIDVTLGSVVTKNEFIRAYKYNGLTYINFHVLADVTASTFTELFRLSDSSACPAAGNYAYSFGGLANRPFQIRVNSSGVLQIYTNADYSNSHFYGSIVFPNGTLSSI